MAAAQGGDAGGDGLEDLQAIDLGAEADRVEEGAAAGVALGDDDGAVEAEEGGAAVVLPVGELADGGEAGLQHLDADAPLDALGGPLDQDLAGGGDALEGAQDDVAGEAVGDDDVGVAGGDVVGAQAADVLEVGAGLLEAAVGVADPRGGAAGGGAVGEQGDARAIDARDLGGVGGAHGREGDEVVAGALDGGADVEQEAEGVGGGAVRAQGRVDGRERGAADGGDPLQGLQGGGDDGTGAAGGDEDRGGVAGEQFHADGDARARGFQEGGAELELGVDAVAGVDDPQVLGVVGDLLQGEGDLGLVADDGDLVDPLEAGDRRGLEGLTAALASGTAVDDDVRHGPGVLPNPGARGQALGQAVGVTGGRSGARPARTRRRPRSRPPRARGWWRGRPRGRPRARARRRGAGRRPRG